MKVKIKKLHSDAVIPSYAKSGDSGMDITAVSRVWDKDNNVWCYGTGLSFEIPDGYVGLLFPRSSIFKQDLSLSNAVGVLDSGYRGEVLFKFKGSLSYTVCGDVNINSSNDWCYNVGDRIGQIIIMPYPKIEFEEVEELTESERGVSGYGSTGN